jgi:hypothetical protein
LQSFLVDRESVRVRPPHNGVTTRAQRAAVSRTEHLFAQPTVLERGVLIERLVFAARANLRI